MSETQENKRIEQLVESAQKGSASVLSDPLATKSNGFVTPLTALAMTGNIAVLAHPDVGTIADKYGMTALHHLAETIALEKKGVKKETSAILRHPMVAVPKTKEAQLTPLHMLAMSYNRDLCHEVFRHPEADKAQNANGQTPLHFLAAIRIEEVLSHPSAFTVMDNSKRTPADVLAEKGNYQAQQEIRKRAQQESEL